MQKILLFILISFSSISYGQVAGGMPNTKGFPESIPSPNAAALGEYGQIPVSKFTGRANINIPIFSAENVAISLSYHGGGIRPDQHSSWVGVGWNLNVGGAITRIVNGGVDEFYDLDNSTDYVERSYYSHPDVLDKSNWHSEANTYSYGTDIFNLDVPIPSPDEFTFNFNGISGSFFYNHKGKWIVKSDGST